MQHYFNLKTHTNIDSVLACETTLRHTRRALHQIPELGFELPKTMAFVKTRLESLGYSTQTTAQSGIIARKEGLTQKAVAFRSDMDALPIFENTGADYGSTHYGNMHACGHDGHMTMLLAFAAFIGEQPTLKQSVVFIFQPAEETGGGAKEVIKESILKKHHVQSIFGIHLFPELPEGMLGFKTGTLMAQDGEVDVTVNGLGTHGAQPHLGRDAILAASHLVTQYHSVMGRFIDPRKAAVINVGSIKSGGSRNVVSEKAELEGTLRAFDHETYETLKTTLRRINQGVETSFNVQIDTVFKDLYPPVVNNDEMHQILLSTFSEDEYQLMEPLLLAEDFAYYQEETPGYFVMLGTRNEAKGFTYPLHSPQFNFDESVLKKGLETYIRIADSLDVL
jgi:amidohydrolase